MGSKDSSYSQGWYRIASHSNPSWGSIKFLAIGPQVLNSHSTSALAPAGDGAHVELSVRLPARGVSRQVGGDAPSCCGRCCARRRLPELLSAGSGLGGQPVWSKSANPALPQFPCLAQPAARCVWLPGSEAGTAAAHVLALGAVCSYKG